MVLKDPKLAIALKLEALLRESADEDLEEAMTEALELMDQRELLDYRPSLESPRAFARTAILENEDLAPTDQDAERAAEAVTVEELIESLPTPVR